MDEYEKDIELCDDGNRGRARKACYERAGNRLTNCYTTGSYNRLGRWTFEDATGQPQGDENPDKRRKKSGPNARPNPDPEKKPDKSEFSLGSMFTDSLANTLGTALAMNPALWSAVDPDGMQSKMNRVLRNFAMLPSDYPEQMRPFSAWSPQPFHYTWVNAMPMPLSSAASPRIAPPVR